MVQQRGCRQLGGMSQQDSEKASCQAWEGELRARGQGQPRSSGDEGQDLRSPGPGGTEQRQLRDGARVSLPVQESVSQLRDQLARWTASWAGKGTLVWATVGLKGRGPPEESRLAEVLEPRDLSPVPGAWDDVGQQGWT